MRIKFKKCVFGCEIREKITMHRFPSAKKFPERFKAWLSLVGDNLSQADYYDKRVCDIHFLPEHRVRFNRLNALAIPTLHLYKSRPTIVNSNVIEDVPAVIEESCPTIEYSNVIEDVSAVIDVHTNENCSPPNSVSRELLKEELIWPIYDNDSVTEEAYLDIKDDVSQVTENAEDSMFVDDPLELQDDNVDLSKVCRICLTTKCKKMFSLERDVLCEAFSQIIGDEFPGVKMACSECSARLLNALRLRERAKRAHDQLMRLASDDMSVNVSEIESIDRNEHDLASKLVNVFIEIVDIPVVDSIVSNRIYRSDPQKLKQYKANSESSRLHILYRTETNVDNDEDIKVINEKCLKRPSLSVTRQNPNKKMHHSFMQMFTHKLLTQEEQIQRFSKLVALEKDKAYKCTVCCRGFDTHYLLDKHRVHHSAASGNIVCLVCKMRLKSSHSLEWHLWSHSREYRCIECDFVTLNRGAAMLHYKEHTKETFPDDDDIIKCPNCKKEFRTKSTFQRHTREECLNKGLCGFCGRMVNNLYYHQSKKHSQDLWNKPVNLMMIYCEECCKYFASQTAYNTHTIFKHVESAVVKSNADEAKCKEKIMREPIMCEKCSMVLPSWEKYTVHYEVNHLDAPFEIPKNDFMCEKCGMTFTSSSFLAKHSLKHKDLYICGMCDKICNAKYHLEKHIKAMHTDRKRYICHICNKELSQSNHLKRHLLIHEEKRPAECPICFKSYVTRRFLLRHLKSHTNDLPQDEL